MKFPLPKINKSKNIHRLILLIVNIILPFFVIHTFWTSTNVYSLILILMMPTILGPAFYLSHWDKNFFKILAGFIFILIIIILGYKIYFKIWNFSFIKIFLIYLFIFAIPAFLFWYSTKLDFNKGFALFVYYSLILTILFTSFTKTEYFSKNISPVINKIEREIETAMEKDNTETYRIIKERLELLKEFYPAIIFITLMIYFSLNYLIYLILISFTFGKPLFINIFWLKVPDFVIWLFILFWGILLLILSINIKYQIVEQIIFNICIIISFLYFLQGCLIILFFSFLFKWNLLIKFLIILIISYLLFFSGLKLPVSLIIMGLGVLDLWVNFRRIDRIEIDKKI